MSKYQLVGARKSVKGSELRNAILSSVEKEQDDIRKISTKKLQNLIRKLALALQNSFDRDLFEAKEALRGEITRRASWGQL